MTDMYEFDKIPAGNIALMVLGATLFIVGPVLIWILWTVKKKEKFTTILVGAATFFVFVNSSFSIRTFNRLQI